MSRTVEIVAPVGKLSSVLPVISAGADALYCGAIGLSARDSSGFEFSLGEIRKAIRLCHAAKRKLYVALNKSLGERQLSRSYALARRICEHGVDALVVSDAGLLARLRDEAAIDVPLHLSSNAGVMNIAEARMYARAGVRRIVFDTNLYIDEMAAICKAVRLEYEIIVGGGICLHDCFRCPCSHQTPQGRVVHTPCSLRYRLVSSGKVLGSSRTVRVPVMCAGSLIETLALIGITHLKIEGRTKPLDYVLRTVGSLRRRVDNMDLASDCASTVYVVDNRYA